MSAADRIPPEIGRYRVVRLLGQGAMGRVLLAHDPVLDRDVAVKLLRDDLGVPSDQERALLDRMRQEARASARVSHPNIVALHDMGEDPRLGLFLVFEYLAGETLKERLERGPLGPVAAARLAREMGSALNTAHDAGVLHRDIKPDNIILARTGANIADFGIARVPDSTLTLGGGLLGTPAYSAPEAVSGGNFSPASDQFSMAATLYEAISGRRAFPGDDAVAVASRITTEEPPKIAAACGIDPHLDTVLSRGLAKNPKARYPGCEEFGAAVAEALELAPRSTMPTEPDRVHRAATETQEEGVAARMKRAAVGGAAVGALLTIAAFQLTLHLREEAPAQVVPEALASAEPPPAATTEAVAVAWLDERPKEDPAAPSKRLREAIREAALRAGSKQKKHDAGAQDAGADARSAQPTAEEAGTDASQGPR